MFKFVISRSGVVYIGKSNGAHGYHADICDHLPRFQVVGAGWLRHDHNTEKWECFGSSLGYDTSFNPAQEKLVVEKIQHLSVEDLLEMIYNAYKNNVYGVSF